jgi:transposase
MKYTKEERLKIGKRIYDGEITRFEAAEEYGIGDDTARDYMRYYRDMNNLPVKGNTRRKMSIKLPKNSPPAELSELAKMSKDELIQEVIKERINSARLKKGYEVKGGGCLKEFIPLDSENTK